MSVSKVENKELPKIFMAYTLAPTLTATGVQTLIPAGQHPKMTLVKGGITMFVAGA